MGLNNKEKKIKRKRKEREWQNEKIEYKVKRKVNKEGLS